MQTTSSLEEFARSIGCGVSKGHINCSTQEQVQALLAWRGSPITQTVILTPTYTDLEPIVVDGFIYKGDR